MSNKQTEALKLALAGLVKASRYGFGEFEEEKSAISSAIQHLEMAEQPAQQQEPFCYHDGHDIVGKEFADHSDVFPLYTSPQPAQQQEPVAWRAWFDADNGARWLFSLWPEEERLDVEWQPLYTSPPSSKPWVGLTDEDVYPLANEHLRYQSEGYEVSGIYDLSRAIEAKLKEKNTGETK